MRTKTLLLLAVVLTGCNGDEVIPDTPVEKIEFVTPAEHPYTVDLGDDDQVLTRTVPRVPGWGDGVHHRAVDGFLLSPDGAPVQAADALNYVDDKLKLIGPRPTVEAIEKFLADRRDMMRKGEAISLHTRFVKLNSDVLPEFDAGPLVIGNAARSLLWGVVSKETSDALGDGFRVKKIDLPDQKAAVLYEKLVPSKEAGTNYGPFNGAWIRAGATLSRRLLAGALVVAQAPEHKIPAPGWRAHHASFQTAFALREGEELLVVWDFAPGRAVTAMLVSWRKSHPNQ